MSQEFEVLSSRKDRLSIWGKQTKSNQITECTPQKKRLQIYGEKKIFYSFNNAIRDDIGVVLLESIHIFRTLNQMRN